MGSWMEIGISEFKAKCMNLVEQVAKTKHPLRITKHGRVIAQVVPASSAPKADFLDSLKGTLTINGDIVGSIVSDEMKPR